MQSSNKMKWISLIMILTLAACGTKDNKQPLAEQKPVQVTIGTVNSISPQAIISSGQIESAQTVSISTRIMGRINAIYVKAGDRVRKGQVLATISDEDIRAKRAQTDAMIAEAEAAFASAQKDLDRFTNLYKLQSATAKELDNMTLQYNAAKARVEAARQMRSEVNASLNYSTLTAPFDGIVTQKIAEAGNLASPGMPLLTIEQNGILQASAAIAESDISLVKLGAVANVEIKSTGRSFKGKLTQLNPSSQFTGGQYIIKISIPDSVSTEIYSGMYVNVSIPLETPRKQVSDAVTVPITAIVHRDELTGIYTVSNDGHALLRWIRLGKTYGDQTEVISGLSANEKFILSSESKLSNGAPVKIK